MSLDSEQNNSVVQQLSDLKTSVSLGEVCRLLHLSSYPLLHCKDWTVTFCLCVPNLAPVVVILNTVDGQGNHLDTSLLELIADSGGAGELSGADWREVPRVGKQDAPSAEENTH